MRIIVIIWLIFLFTFLTYAQEQTLISGEIESGGFGSPVVKITKINGESAVLVGGRGGWIINHTFVLGGGGYGLVTNVNAIITDSTHQYLQMGYGGIDLEHIISSNSLLHFSTGLLIGGGGVGYQDERDNFLKDSHRMNSFFILEPSVQTNLNVTHFFRIAAGISYRYVSGLKSTLTTNDDLSGPSAVLALKFGKF